MLVSNPEKTLLVKFAIWEAKISSVFIPTNAASKENDFSPCINTMFYNSWLHITKTWVKSFTNLVLSSNGNIFPFGDLNWISSIRIDHSYYFQCHGSPAKLCSLVLMRLTKNIVCYCIFIENFQDGIA